MTATDKFKKQAFYMMSSIFFTLISQFFFLTSCTEERTQPLPSSTRLEKKVLQIAKDRKIPSLALSISSPQLSVDLEYNHRKVEKQDIYGIGSTTKFLAAIVIFKLIEDNKINLSDPVSDYVQLDVPIQGFNELTVENLLNHTSGLSDYTKNQEWINSVMQDKAPATFDEKLVLVEQSLNGDQGFRYSNSNYLFLQKVVETVTGKSYTDVFDDFYASHGLTEIRMGNPNSDLQAYYAQKEEAISEVSSWNEHYGFDGGAYATARGLQELLTKLFQEKSILAASTLAQMEKWIPMEDMTIPVGIGTISEYGNGVMKLTYGQQSYIGHFGSTLKYQSMVFHHKEEGISISVATNCSGNYFNQVFFQELIPAILQELHQVGE